MPASRRAVTDPHNQATPRHDYLDEMMNACCKKAARHDRAEQSAVPEQAVTPRLGSPRTGVAEIQHGGQRARSKPADAFEAWDALE
jgi:hypothetical protein